MAVEGDAGDRGRVRGVSGGGTREVADGLVGSLVNGLVVASGGVGGEIDGRDGLRVGKSGVRVADKQKRFRGAGYGKNAFNLPVGGGDDDDVVGSGVGDIDQMSGFIDDYAAG